MVADRPTAGMKLQLLLFAVSALGLCHAKVFYNGPHQDVPKWRLPDTNSSKGKHWALIVAGSNTWDNYRHQADACHAYQIVKRNGIPEENIITMMYDDIAYNKENPTPGVIINRPNGMNVYDDVKIDYRGNDVSPANFLAILSGNNDTVRGGNGRVIVSGPDDHIFVNFAGLGDSGILGFPNYDEVLFANDLIATLTNTHAYRTYKQMVIYIEASASGSMFEGILPDYINIYATTASNSTEDSYPCYCENDRNTCLGDVYSVNWMEDSDIADLRRETLQTQFQHVKRETSESHVQEFGDMTISEEDVAEFQGGPSYEPSVLPVLPKVPLDAVPADEVPLSILQHRLAAAKDEDLKKRLLREIDDLLELRNRVTKTMQDIVSFASDDFAQYNLVYAEGRRQIDFDCYKPTLNLFKKRCYNLSTTYSVRKQLKFLVNMCAEKIPTERILEAIVRVCKD